MRLVGGMDAAAPIDGSAGADTAGARNCVFRPIVTGDFAKS